MSSKKEGAIAEEVEGRLDDLFGEGGDDEGQAEFSAEGKADDSDPDFSAEEADDSQDEFDSIRPSLDAENSLIKDLKSVVLSLEWEITDSVMQKLGEEIEKLKVSCKKDKIVIAFLQLVEALGKYIQKKQALAHPDSISLLNSVYDHLEKVMLSPDLTDAVKKKMLASQLAKYKDLQGKIKEKSGTSKPPKPPRKKPDPATTTFMPGAEPPEEEEEVPVVAAPSVGGSEDMVVQLLTKIHKELRAIREELRNR